MQMKEAIMSSIMHQWLFKNVVNLVNLQKLVTLCNFYHSWLTSMLVNFSQNLATVFLVDYVYLF